MKKQKLYLSTIDPGAHLLAQRYGLGLEIAEYCTASNLDDNFPQTDAAVREKLAHTDRWVLHGPFNELFPCAIDPKVRELARMRYLQAIDAARGYGIRKIILHAGHNPWLYYPVWFEEQSIVFWRSFVREIPEDVTVCIENVLEDKPEMLTNILRAVDSPRLRMCLDVGHVNAYSKVGVMEWLRDCGEFIDHFHIHNNDGSWDTHSPLDAGTIPMTALFAAIDEQCPGATVTLELPEAEPSVRWLLEKGLLEAE